MATSNTGEQKVNRPGTFVKGDPRVNRKGRPKSFDQLRALAQRIAHETLDLTDGTKRTVAEAIVRKIATEDPKLFLEIAFGKVPNPVEHTGKNGGPIETKTNEIARLTTEQIEQLIAIAESVGTEAGTGAA